MCFVCRVALFFKRNDEFHVSGKTEAEIHWSPRMTGGRLFEELFQRNPFEKLRAEDFPSDEQNFFTDLDVFSGLIALSKPRLIIEVGSWKGHSANAMADICKQGGLDTKIVCVDTWLGSQEHYVCKQWYAMLHILHRRPTLWERFIGNVLRRQNQDRIYPLPLNASAAAALFLDMDVKADLIFIDAGHEYDDISADIDDYYDLLEVDGVMFGDNFHYPPIRRAVYEFSSHKGLRIANKGNKWVLFGPSAQLDRLPGYEVVFPAGWSLSQRSRFAAVHEFTVCARTNLKFATKFNGSEAFEGQSFQQLDVLLDEGQLPSRLAGNYCTIENGYFLIGPGNDGVLLTADGQPIIETLNFIGRTLPDRAALAQSATELDFDVFISVDAAWNYYYHWLCIAIPKMLMARHFDASPFRTVIPDYRGRREAGWPMKFNETTWDQSLYLTGISDNIVVLPPGIYKSDRINTILIDNRQPAYLSCLDEFADLYEPIRSKLRECTVSPKRIIVRRRDSQRISQTEYELLEHEARQRGFVGVYLEDLDFRQQAELFFNAEVVIAPHGAGLSNIIFGKSTLRILEINRFLGSEQYLRPWFYLLACGRKQSYTFLNATAGELEPEKVRSAIDKICARLPAGSETAKWWTARQEGGRSS